MSHTLIDDLAHQAEKFSRRATFVNCAFSGTTKTLTKTNTFNDTGTSKQ